VAEQCIAHVERDGGSEEDTQALVSLGAMAITKVAALAVAESARNQGIGAALLSRVKRLYFHHGYLYVYGQMPHRPGLPEFYRRQGFEVKQPGEPLDLWVVFGIPVVVHSGPDHRLFVRGRPRTDHAST
jgi:GNAT superfamily N-acetyltransferase